MATTVLRCAILTTSIFYVQLLTSTFCKEILVETEFQGASNERGEFGYADYRHYHISNHPLILPNVTTKSGLVRGIVIKMNSGRDVYGFLGIPFAKPPIGELRFKEPVPVEDWNTTYYDAVGLPPSCSQLPSAKFPPEFRGEAMWNPSTHVSEDCLYLNIWVAAETFNNAAQKNIHNTSVLFWIHGGEFSRGASSLEIYNGSTLADENDVIVVSAQYRLGPFGFLYFGNEHVPGNMGLLDQNLALRWVYKNIEVFGGDKDFITLFGHDAGSVSASYHLLSTYSQPFIHGAILMAGTALSPWAFQSQEKVKQMSLDLSERVGCGTPETPKTYEEIIQCLRKVDPLLIMKAHSSQTKPFMSYSYVPTACGHFIKDNPKNALKDLGSNTKMMNIIIGSAKDEGSYYMQYEMVHDLNNTPTFTREEFVTQMSLLFGPSSKDACHSVPALNLYTNWVNPEDVDQNRVRISEAIGDKMVICPDRAFADAWSQLGNNAYLYHFTQRTLSSPWPEWMGIVHGDEIEYAFGLPLKGIAHNASEIELSHHMTKLFTNFARTGTPSSNWMAYTEQTPVFLNLNATVISDETPANMYGPRAETCAFWNNYGAPSTALSKSNDDIVPVAVIVS